MIKKNLFQKLAVVAMVGVMSLSLVACTDDKGTKDGDTTASAVASENDTEDIQAPDDNDAEGDTEEAVATEAYTEEDGVLTIKHVKLDIPEGYAYFQDMSGTVTYKTDASDKSFAVYAQDDNTYGEQDIVDAYVQQVKNVYGDQVTTETKSYNGHEYTVMDIDSADGSYIGNAAVLCEGSTVVYLEFVTTTDDESDFDTIMNSVSF
ncbi:MAG: hypothetical protein NC225_02335 [Clostridium sp.]|nr:hypothetical protein [Clostridium sp.]MCM1398302.1 hypothetical protein [Clostridium sp.]MCM1459034.1 hypothetical protein [Bacteroides sp.]